MPMWNPWHECHKISEGCRHCYVYREDAAFGKHNVRRRRRFLWPGNRTASIAAITGTSIIAVAAGIAITVAINDNRPEPIPNDVTVTPTVESMSKDMATMRDDTVRIAKEPVIFEDEPLETIMNEVAATYGVEVMLNNKETASLQSDDFSSIISIDKYDDHILVFGETTSGNTVGYLTNASFDEYEILDFKPKSGEIVKSACLGKFNRTAVLTYLDGKTFLYVFDRSGNIAVESDLDEMIPDQERSAEIIPNVAPRHWPPRWAAATGRLWWTNIRTPTASRMPSLTR